MINNVYHTGTFHKKPFYDEQSAKNIIFYVLQIEILMTTGMNSTLSVQLPTMFANESIYILETSLSTLGVLQLGEVGGWGTTLIFGILTSIQCTTEPNCSAERSVKSGRNSLAEPFGHIGSVRWATKQAKKVKNERFHEIFVNLIVIIIEF